MKVFFKNMLTRFNYKNVIIIEINYDYIILFCYDFAIFIFEKINENEIIFKLKNVFHVRDDINNFLFVNFKLKCDKFNFFNDYYVVNNRFNDFYNCSKT